MGATHDNTWLLGQLTGTWIQDTRGGAQYAIAVQFRCVNAMYIDSVAWYASDTNTSHKPTHLDIYDAAGNTIWTTSTIPHDGTTGWQNVALGGQLALYAGQSYRISGCFPANTPNEAQTFVSTQPCPLGVAWGSPVALQNGPGTCARPDTGQNDYFRGLDVHFVNPAPAPGTGADINAIDTDVNSYLSSNSETNIHHDALPWATKAAIGTATDTASQATLFGWTAKATGWLTTLINAMGDFTTMDLSAPLFGRVNTVAGFVSAVITIWQSAYPMLDWLRNTGLPGLQTSLNNANTSLTGLLNDANSGINGLNTGVTRLNGGGGGFTGDSPWSLVAETDWSGGIAWAQPADLYVLTVTSFPPGQGEVDTPAGSWLPRAGWWCVQNGDFAAERHLVEFAKQHLTDNGRRMPGVALRALDCAGHLEAWQLT